MEENPRLNMGSTLEQAAAGPVFPGISFCFLDDPRLIGKERAAWEEETFTLHYCHVGRIQIEQDLGEIVLTGGDIFSVPRIGRENIHLLSKRYSGLSLIISPARARQTIGAFSEDCLGTNLDWEGMTQMLREKQGTVLRDACDLRQVFSQLFQSAPPYEEAYYRLKAMELLLHLSARCSEREGQKQPYLERELMERIEEARQFLIEHLDCRLTQAQIAKQFHVSLTALKRAFRSMYGLTLEAYLRERRIAAAKQLLLETELSVSEVAHRVGYESHSQFTSVFRSYEGQPPMEYRRKQGRRTQL